jgi:hypothetical protein
MGKRRLIRKMREDTFIKSDNGNTVLVRNITLYIRQTTVAKKPTKNAVIID